MTGFNFVGQVGPRECWPLIMRLDACRQAFDSDVRRFAKAQLRPQCDAEYSIAKMPDVLLSDNIELVTAFLQQHRKVVLKSSASDSQAVFADGFTVAQLTFALAQSALLLQEYIPGITIRTYVWGRSVINTEIRSRFDGRAGHVKEQTRIVTVPADIDLFSLSLCEYLKLDCAILSWRKDCKDRYYFIKIRG